MAQAIVDVQDFVSVSVVVTPLAIPFLAFGIPIIAGDSNVIDVGQRYRVYTTDLQVANDFGTTAPEYLAATIFFEQSPQPQTCMIGRWASTATKGLVHGATLTPTQQLLSNFTGIASGSMFIIIDGVPTAITGVSLTAALNLNGVASSVQAQLPAGVTCIWDSAFQRFNVTSSTTGSVPGSNVSNAAAPTAVGKFTFAAQPANLNTVVIAGTTITFVTGTPSAGQVQISAVNLAGTLASLLSYVQSSADVNLVKCLYTLDDTSNILYLYAAAPGVAGNSLTITSVGANITPSGATLAGATGTDISGLLGLTVASGGPAPVPGIAAETLTQCVAALANATSQWYGVTWASVVQPTQADVLGVAAFITASARSRIFGVSTQDTGVLTPGVTTDIASVLQTFNQKRVFCMYSSSTPYSVMTMMGRAFTVNFQGSNTTITLAYKQAPGLQPEYLNETQFATLVASGANVNIAVDNGAVMIWPGQMSNGYWFDEVHGVDWLANQIQTTVFNGLYTTSTKVPQTDAGDNQIAGWIEGACQQGITNGLGAPGVWQASGFGSLQQGDPLPKGFYVYYPLIATQPQNLREARVSVVFQTAFKLAGAVHQAQIVLNINR